MLVIALTVSVAVNIIGFIIGLALYKDVHDQEIKEGKYVIALKSLLRMYRRNSLMQDPVTNLFQRKGVIPFNISSELEDIAEVDPSFARELS